MPEHSSLSHDRQPPSKAGFVALDASGRIKDASLQFCTMCGYPPTELATLTILDLDPAETRDSFQARVQQIGLSAGRVFLTRHRHRDGHWYDVECTLDRSPLSGMVVYLARPIPNIPPPLPVSQEEHSVHAALLDGNVDSVKILNLDGRVLYANRSAAAMLGYTQDELLCVHIQDIDPSWDLERFRTFWGDIPEGGEVQIRTHHRHKSGRLIPVMIRAIAIRHAGAKAVLGISRDLGPQLHAEQQLRDTAARLIAAQDMVNMGYWDVLHDKGTLTWSDAVYRMFGKDPATFTPPFGRFSELVHPKDRSLLDRTWASHLAGGGDETVEHRIVLDDGTIRWVIQKWRTTFDDAGTPLRTSGIILDMTERKHAEERIRLFKTVSDSALYGNAITDPEGRIVYLNCFFAQVHGYEPDELLGKHLSIFHTDRQMESVRALLDTFTTDGAFSPVEVWHVHRDGHEFPMLMSGVLIRDEDGTPTHMAASAVDLTSYHQIKDEYQTLFTEMREAFALHEIICDEDGKPIDYQFLAVNPAFESMTGLDMRDVVGKRVLDLLPETEPFWLQTYGKVALEGEPAFFENYSVSLDRYYEVRAFCPAPGQFACIFLDITARRAAEDSLRVSEKKFRTYIESAPEGIFIVDNEGRYVDVNPAGCTMTGYTKAELLEMSVRDLASPEGLEQTFTSFADLLATGEVSREILMRRKDGADVDVLLRAVKLGENRYIGYCSDITDYKRLQERLQHSEKMTAIGQLAGGVAHDFNNQLTGILGYAHMLHTRLDDPTLKRYAETITTAARRASDLTRQLLSFSRKGKYLTLPVDVHHVLHEVVDILQHSASKKVQIHQHLDANPSMVLGDPNQLQNAFLNLAMNACDAMPDGGTLTFATRVVRLDGDPTDPDVLSGEAIQVAVHDTGEGMEAATVKRIFEPFFTTKDPGKGTGLGLAAVHGAVANHHGTIRVESRRGEGTVFYLCLPLFLDAIQKAPSDPPAAVSARPARILVIDDEQVILDLAGDMLTSAGHTVTTSNDPEAALQMYATSWKRIDLVILDMIMPGLDGKEVYREMRRINPQARVVLASGYSLDQEVQKLVDDGAVGFVQKPFDSGSLVDEIRRVLDASPFRPSD